MENAMRGNIKISGAGSATGGIYDEVKISGAGEVNGDIECNVFKSSGASTVKGNIKTKEIKVSGAAEIRGDLEAEEIKVSGAVNIRGDVKTKFIKISGAATVKGNLQGEQVEIQGSATIGGDCEVEYFKAKGGFQIGGLLNADTVEIRLAGKGSAKEIGGEKIEVRYGNWIGSRIQQIIKEFFNWKEELNAEIIEGDDIYLEGTIAKIVRGNNVTIGKDCDIDLVEYSKTINIIENGKVKEQRMPYSICIKC